MEIEIKNLSNFFLQNVNLKVKEGEFFVLLGPNGAGKTTLLNTIAGLISYSGNIYFNKVRMNGNPTKKRRIGYLFQDLFLFPHLTVFENIAYGLRSRNYNGNLKIRVNEVLNLLRISKFRSRYPANLSGGEKQKVALARALAIEPVILLLDEPFKSIDQYTAKYLGDELKRLQKKLKITTIYVTHNLLEAEEMANRIAVICNGRICEIGTISEIFFNSRNPDVLDFIGSPNILNADSYRVLESGLFLVECGGINIIVPYEGKKIKKLAILPHDIYISPFQIPGSNLNKFKGKVIEIKPHSSAVRMKIALGKNVLSADLNQNIFNDFNIKTGDFIHLLLNLKWIKVYG